MTKIKKSNYTIFYKDLKKYSLEYAVKHTVDIGFDAVEIFDVARPSQWLGDEDSFLKLKDLLASNNLGLSCYSVAINLLGDDIDDVMKRTRRHIVNAARLGSPYFHHTLVPSLKFSNLELSFDSVFERVIDNAEKIASLCNENGLVCLYEPQGAYFNGVSCLRTLLEEIRNRGYNVGVCGDMGNSLFADCKPSDIFKEFSADIKHIHVKDYRICEEAQENAYVSLGGKYLVPVSIGEGDADIKGCMAYVKEYNGYFSIESEESDEKLGQIESCLI